MAGSASKKQSNTNCPPGSRSNSSSHSRSSSSSSSTTKDSHSGASNTKKRPTPSHRASSSLGPEPPAKRSRKTQQAQRTISPQSNRQLQPIAEDNNSFSEDEDAIRAREGNNVSTPDGSQDGEREGEDKESSGSDGEGLANEKLDLKDFYDSAKGLGRNIARTIVFCADIPATFHQGLLRITHEYKKQKSIDADQLESFELPEAASPRSEKQEAELNDFFALFCRIYRAFPDMTIRIIESNEKVYKKAVSRVSLGANSGRSTDLRAVKLLVSTKWFPGLRNLAKIGWGFHHPKTGKLLLPADVDPSSEEAIAMYRANERLAFPPAEPPRVFFNGPMNAPADVDNPSICFLRNPYLVAALCQIYLSEDDALKMFTPGGKGDYEAVGDTVSLPILHSRPSVCKGKSIGREIRFENITPHSIAYTACLLRSVLSSEEQLRNEVEDPNTHYAYATVYHEIVDYFQDPESGGLTTVGKELLAWWDRHVFGGREAVVPTAPPRLSMRERALAQLAATAPTPAFSSTTPASPSVEPPAPRTPGSNHAPLPLDQPDQGSGTGNDDSPGSTE